MALVRDFPIGTRVTARFAFGIVRGKVEHKDRSANKLVVRTDAGELFDLQLTVGDVDAARQAFVEVREVTIIEEIAELAPKRDGVEL